MKVVSTRALEDAADQARKIVEQNMDKFDKLRVAIRSSYARLVKDLGVSAGRRYEGRSSIL